MCDSYQVSKTIPGIAAIGRRRFVEMAGLAGAGILLLPSQLVFARNKDSVLADVKPFQFQNEPPRQRKSFHDLADDELVLLCKAVSQMRNGSKDVPLSMSSPRQWDQWVTIHEKHCTEDGPGIPQVHWSWFFLPWHRAYLWFLERHLAHILTDDLHIQAGTSFALPYWDWITHKEIPNTGVREGQAKPSPLFGYNDALEDMVNDDNLGFDNMALWDGNRGPTLQKPKMDPGNELTRDSKDHVAETVKFTSSGFIDGILDLPFEYFAGKPVISRQDGQGVLEIGPHNDVHDWVGSRLGKNRDMGTLRYAALDPIFFMHHANVDRIWSWYKKPQPDPDTSPWGAQSYIFSDLDGSPVSITVKDIVKSMTNITYVEPQTTSPEAAKIFSFLQSSSASNPTIKTETLMQTSQVLRSQPLTMNVQPPVGPNALINSEAVEKTPLALIEIETGPITYRDKFTIRLFVNKPDANRDTTIEDPHYVGRIGGLDSENRGNETKEERSHTFPILLNRSDSTFYRLVRPGEQFSLTLVPVGPRSSDKTFEIQVKSIKLKIFE